MADGSDAVADWPLLNAMVNVACGASWVSIHHGGGVGMGLSIHAGQVCVADGTPEAGERIRRVLTADPGMGIVRHADAGEPLAVAGGRAQRGADADARPGVTSVVVSGALEVLRGRPRPALPAPRPRRRARARPGADDPRGRPDRRLRGRRRAPTCASTPRAARCCRASSTATRTCPSPAGARRSTSRRSPACPTRRSPARAAGSPPARAPSPRRPTTRCWPRPGRSRPRCSPPARRPSSPRRGYGLSVDAEARAVRLGRELGADRVTGLFAHAVPEGYDRDDWMDCVDALAASCDVDALDIYVESVAFTNENLAHLGAIAARAGRAAARPRRAVQRQPLGAGGAGRGRALGRPPRLPAPRRRRSAGGRRVRRGAPARRGVPRRRARRPGARRWPTRAPSACWAPT